MLEFIPAENAIIQPTELSRDDVLHLLATDREFAIQFTIPDELKFEIPEIHTYVLDQMMNASAMQSSINADGRLRDRLCIAIPRGFAKTTIAKIVVALKLYFTPHRFCVYVSNTHTVAANALRDVVSYLKSPNYISTFGAPQFDVEQEAAGFYIFSITDAQGKKKKCILRALGAGQQVRGLNVDNQRPSLAIVDDIESREEIATPEQLKKLTEWFYSTFLKALDGFFEEVIQVGNMVQPKCLINTHCNSPYWRSIRLGSIKPDGSALWPKKWSIEELAKDFAEYQREGIAHLWYAEMMNTPMPSGNGLIKPERIAYCEPLAVDDPRIQYGVITVDPASSKKTWGNETAIAAHCYIQDFDNENPLARGEYWQLVEIVATKNAGDPIRLFEVCFALAEKWRISFVCVESGAYQNSIVPVMDYLMVERRIHGLEVHPIPAAGQSKTQRLTAWAALIASRAYRVPYGSIGVINQLLAYDPTTDNNEDDRIDACAHIITATRLYLSMIQASLDRRITQQTAVQQIVNNKFI